MDLESLARQAAEIVQQAGALVRGLEHPKVFTKEGHANFVTEADLASQKFLMERLAPLLPEAHFFAEEQEDNRLHPGFNWIIDPIDGTTNFMRGYRPCAISVGLVEDDVGVLGLVYDVWGDELFSAVQGEGAFLNGQPIHAAETPLDSALIVFGTALYNRKWARATFAAAEEVFLHCGDLRRSGSAAIDLCSVAAGRSDGFFELYLSPWDFCGASVILREAGALTCTTGGAALCYDRGMPVVAGNPEVFDWLSGVVEKHLPEAKE